MGWEIAFATFPFGPFLYLAILRAIAWPLALGLSLAIVVTQSGLVSVLAKTNQEPWQPWLVLLLGSMLYGFGTIQYLLGRPLWAARAERIWRGAGWLFGVLLVFGVATQVIGFHLSRLGATEADVAAARRTH